MSLASLFSVEPPEWIAEALCAETDPAIFFPDIGGSIAAPKRVCNACPVRAECMESALEDEPGHGIYGGLTPMERRAVRNDRKAAAKEAS